MKILSQYLRIRSRQTLLAVLFASAVASSYPLHAGPGAHGPNGEHLDSPGTTASAGNTSPRVESKSETFELVARLEDGVLAILIDRYETNEPVLDASVDVESAGAKAKATFRPDLGDYAVTEPAILKLLAKPETHSLIFTIAAGKDSDLLDGKLIPGNAVPQDSVAGSPGIFRGMSMTVWIAIAILGIGAAVFLFRRRQIARRFAYKRAGGA